MTSIDKANVLAASRLWRRTVIEVAREYPDVELEHRYVDAAAFELIAAPKRFDVVLADNLFGDVLSDELGAVVGGIGLLASASLKARLPRDVSPNRPRPGLGQGPGRALRECLRAATC